jgi:hypothetical protein
MPRRKDSRIGQDAQASCSHPAWQLGLPRFDQDPRCHLCGKVLDLRAFVAGETARSDCGDVREHGRRSNDDQDAVLVGRAAQMELAYRELVPAGASAGAVLSRHQ